MNYDSNFSVKDTFHITALRLKDAAKYLFQKDSKR